MWIKQYKYPFTNIMEDNKIVLSFENVKFVQIGMECPHSIPIFLYDNELTNINNKTLNTQIEISETLNGTIISNYSYKINSSDILEFNNLNKKNLTIKIENPEDPYTIITIAYEKED